MNECLEKCSLDVTDNELKIYVRQLKREVEELIKTTNATLLIHDHKIAELCMYVKDNLSNTLRCLFDTMLANGELENIITDTLLNTVNQKIFYLNCATDFHCSYFQEGDVVQTLGYSKASDGGSGLYRIRARKSTDVMDCGLLHTTKNDNVAELINEESINIATIKGDSLNEKFDNLRPLMKEYKYKRIIIPNSNENNSACYKYDNKYYWKVTAPIKLDDVYNCLEIDVNDRFMGVNNMSSIIEIFGKNKPENIIVKGFLELIALPNIATITNGIHIKNGGRIIFDNLLVNYCENGVFLGDNENGINGCDFKSNFVGVGYYSACGFKASSNVSTSLQINTLSVQNPLKEDLMALYLNGLITNSRIGVLEIFRNIGKQNNKGVYVRNTYNDRLINVDIDYMVTDDALSNILDIQHCSLCVNSLRTSAPVNTPITLIDNSICRINNFLSYVSPKINLDATCKMFINSDITEILSTNGNIIINGFASNENVNNHIFIDKDNELLKYKINGRSYTPLLDIYKDVITSVDELPTPSWEHRGKMIYLQNSGTNDDILYVCMRSSNSGYYWKEITFS